MGRYLMLMFCVGTPYTGGHRWMGTDCISDTAACLGYPYANTHLYVVLMGNKVGYKRRDVYGTLLPCPPTPHLLLEVNS